MSGKMVEPNGFTLCNRVLDHPNPFIENCIKEKCCKCGMDVWVSPATILSIKEGLYSKDFICEHCLMNLKEVVNDVEN